MTVIIRSQSEAEPSISLQIFRRETRRKAMLSSPADAGLRGYSPREKLPLFRQYGSPAER